MTENENQLWEFSIKAYGQEKLATRCLQLQDQFGLDVNLILLFVWAGFSGARLTDEAAAHIIKHAKAWQETTVQPLRQIRRQLKSDIGAVNVEKSTDFREKVKQLELEAERIQQDMLMELLLKSPAMNARDGERKSVARRNLLTYLHQMTLKPDAEIKLCFEEILKLSEQAFLAQQLAGNENQCDGEM